MFVNDTEQGTAFICLHQGNRLCSFTPDTVLLQMGLRHLCLFPLLLCNCTLDTPSHLVWRATWAVSAAQHCAQGVLQSELCGEDWLSQNEPDVVNRPIVARASGWREKRGRHLLLTVHLKFCVSGLLVCSSLSLYGSISALELRKKEGKYFMVILSLTESRYGGYCQNCLQCSNTAVPSIVQ